MKVFYFTGTGNSLQVAEEFRKSGAEIFSITELIKKKETSFTDKKIGIVFPCYSGTLPIPVREFIEKTELKSNYFFAVITYGAMAAGTVDRLIKLGKRSNIQFSYIRKICMVDNYLPMFDIEKELIRKDKNKIKEKISEIRLEVMSSVNRIESSGFLGKIISAIAEKKYYEKHSEFIKRFIVDDICNSCGTCSKVCPSDNITVNDKPVFHSNCCNCLACVNLCPLKAIRLKKEKGTARYMNEEITLKQIIDSNN